MRFFAKHWLLFVFVFYTVRSWMAAVGDFTELISKELYNGKPYLYRGKTYAKLVRIKCFFHKIYVYFPDISLEPQYVKCIYC